MPHLIKIQNSEWKTAEAFFKEEDKQQVKAKKSKINRKIEVKFKNRKKTDHSFIRINGEIFAIANKNAAGLAGHLLGEGAFGKVRMVQNRAGENFAVKIEARGIRGEEDTETKIMKILGYLKGEDARAILEPDKFFKGEESITEKLYTITELRKGDELFKHLYLDAEGEIRKPDNPEKNPNELLKERLIIALHACNAIKALHEKNIIHGDIKPQNFMIDASGGTIIVESIDYGCSLMLTPPATQVLNAPQGTPFFMAPETKGIANIYEGQGVFSFASDVFALGMMFGEDLQLDQDLNMNELIKKMTDRYPSRRPSMNEIIQSITLAIENPTLHSIQNDHTLENIEIEDNGKYDTMVDNMDTSIRAPEEMLTSIPPPAQKISPSLIVPEFFEKKEPVMDINDQLIQAIKEHKLITVIQLLKAGADPNTIDKISNEPVLMLAINTIPAHQNAPKQTYAMHNAIILTLIERQKEKNFDFHNQDGNTMLMLAIKNKASVAIINSLSQKNMSLENKKAALALSEQFNQKEMLSIVALGISTHEFSKKWNENFLDNAYLNESRSFIPKINPFLYLFKKRKISETRQEQLSRLSGAIAALGQSKNANQIDLVLHVFHTIGYIQAQLKKESNWLGSRLSTTLEKVEKDLINICPSSVLSQEKIKTAKQEGAVQYQQTLSQNKGDNKKPSP